MKPLNTLRRVVHNTDHSAKALHAIQTEILNSKIREQMFGANGPWAMLSHKLNHLIGLGEAQVALQQQQNQLLSQLLAASGKGSASVPEVDVQGIVSAATARTAADHFQRPPQAGGTEHIPLALGASFEQAMAAMPLMIAEKTYNTSHPHYDAHAVRNYPGKIFNHRKPCANIVYKELLRMAKGSNVPDSAWEKKFPELLAEARSVPGADQVFERKAFIERYVEEISRKNNAHYRPGWVNLNDALFLYWVVRTLKPKTIVQTGVCNGLSSAFMMLALAKNGPEGSLHVVDLAPVYDSNAPEWKEAGKVYGVVIPEGKSSGWIVPDQYQSRFFVQNGDAKEWLPKVMDKLDSIDLFYHDSDHTYNHMMFEFAEAKKKLRPGGVILGDDISWNESVWDFADQYGVPSYNFLGAVGAAFF